MSSAASRAPIDFSPRLRAASRIQRIASAIRRTGRTSTGTWKFAPPTRRLFTSTIGREFASAVLKTSSGSLPPFFWICSKAPYRMRSATDFLPAVISTLTNFATSLEPNFGSGRISRLGISLRRGISRSVRSDSGQRSGGLRLLRAVLRARLLAVLDARGVEAAAHHVVTHARQVLHAAAADQHHRVLLQVVAFAADVADHLEAVGETDLRDLPQRGVRL